MAGAGRQKRDQILKPDFVVLKFSPASMSRGLGPGRRATPEAHTSNSDNVPGGRCHYYSVLQTGLATDKSLDSNPGLCLSGVQEGLPPITANTLRGLRGFVPALLDSGQDEREVAGGPSGSGGLESMRGAGGARGAGRSGLRAQQLPRPPLPFAMKQTRCSGKEPLTDGFF